MNKRNIGILTCYINNFGACLQAYALQEVLRKNEQDNEIVLYTPVKSMIKYSIVIKIGLKIRLFLKSFSSRLYKFEFYRSYKFDKFRKDFLVFSKENYKHIGDLYKRKMDYDVYIVGSDQIWNPLIHGNKNNEAYFLDFVEDNKKKIAYAPSIGISDVSPEIKEDMRKKISRFTALSIREKSGQEIIRQITENECRVVLDPTLLLNKDDWNKVAKKVIKNKKYIFCYIFSDFEYIEKFIKNAKETLDSDVIVIPLHSRKYNFIYEELLSIGPAEFLGLIRDATLVITDSFHATAFSINYNVPFYSFLRNKKKEKNNMNSRIVDILNETDLQNRIINDDSVNDKLNLKVNFKKANDYLRLKRDEDVKFLIDSIKL